MDKMINIFIRIRKNQKKSYRIICDVLPVNAGNHLELDNNNNNGPCQRKIVDATFCVCPSRVMIFVFNHQLYVT